NSVCCQRVLRVSASSTPMVPMVVGYPILRRLAGSWMLHRILSLLGRPSSDAGPNLKPGSVPEFDRPRHLSFHHPVPAGLKSQGTISSKSRSLMTVSPERPEEIGRAHV